MANKRGIEVLAYAAVIIDGEGCICLSHQSTKKNRLGYSIVLRVQVSNTSEWLCNWLQFQFGGSVGTLEEATTRHKKCYQWYIAARKAYAFLGEITPYLRIKRPQAELALEFQRRRPPPRKGAKESELALDEADRLLMSRYNHRGPSAEQPS